MESRDVNYIMNAHANHARKPRNAFRKWDGATPYYIHPLWCATAIATETRLPKDVRKEGTLTLLYHDILEDTTEELPNWLEPRIMRLVQGMTFPGGSEQEMSDIWLRPPVIRLYKLYDKVSNLLDSTWMNPEKKAEYVEYTQRLCQDVLRNYGELNITRIAREAHSFT